MTEWILGDATHAHNFRAVILRYFNVAGADPTGRLGQATKRATHLIKVAVQVALGKRPYIEVYGTDYPTHDGSCVRDYVQVTDLACAHVAALRYLRHGGDSTTLNCGYGVGSSVLDVIDAVKRVSGNSFEVRFSERRSGDPAAVVAKSDRIRKSLSWVPRYSELDTIVEQAIHWERMLDERCSKSSEALKSGV